MQYRSSIRIERNTWYYTGLYEQKESYFWSPVHVTIAPFPIDHLFQCFIQYIKKYSKNRLRFLTITNVFYLDKTFAPYISYPSLKNIIFLEKNS
jgi:hypothetical protein